MQLRVKCQSTLAPGQAEKIKHTSGSLLQLNEYPPPAAVDGGASCSGGGKIWAPHYGGVGHQHHSDPKNELQLKLINNGVME